MLYPRAMARCGLIAIILGISLSAGAVPITMVRSAVGEAAARNATGRAAWMPQLPANLVFQETLAGTRHRSFVAAPDSDDVQLPVEVTSLRPGETQLTFAGSRGFVSTRASFLTEGP